MTIRIAGIGPRKITAEGLELVQLVASQLAALGFHMNSGHGDGADQAWAAPFPTGQKTIYLPWWGYNSALPDDTSIFELAPQYPDYYALAEKHHRGWSHLTDGAKTLMVRNVAILLSGKLRQPVSAVLYWQDPAIKVTAAGGTQHALRVALDIGLPCFNINTEEGQNGLDKWVNQAMGNQI